MDERHHIQATVGKTVVANKEIILLYRLMIYHGVHKRSRFSSSGSANAHPRRNASMVKMRSFG